MNQIILRSVAIVWDDLKDTDKARFHMHAMMSPNGKIDRRGVE